MGFVGVLLANLNKINFLLIFLAAFNHTFYIFMCAYVYSFQNIITIIICHFSRIFNIVLPFYFFTQDG